MKVIGVDFTKYALYTIVLRGLSQEVVDFFYNKKTIRSSAIKFYM